MSAAFYEGLAATARGILREYGREVTLRRATGSAYNTATSSNTPTYASSTRVGAMFNWGAGEESFDGEAIAKSDRKMILDAGVAPQPGDEIIAGSTTWHIMAVQATEPDGTSVLYNLLLRK